jgi:hypothetical protein
MCTISTVISGAVIQDDVYCRRLIYYLDEEEALSLSRATMFRSDFS